MSSVITSALMRGLRPVVSACGRAVPEFDRGADPRLMVTLTIEIAARALRVASAEVAAVDIAPARRDELARCVREGVSAITVATPDEPDRVGYVVHFPIRLP